MGSIAEPPKSNVDLLIIGGGPAGLLLAAWASQYPNVHTRMVDDKPGRIETGHADGLHSRTLEVFESFGLVNDILKDAYRVNEICSWNPDPQNPKHIRRTQRAPAQADGLSRYPQVSLGQASIEQILLDYLASKDRVHVERSTSPETLHIDQDRCGDKDAYPIELELRDLASDTHETVRAKYVVGCDGARSWVRRQLGIQMEGDRTNRHFGVMDIVPLTNFPDIRESCVMHSNSGSVMTVPRENRLVRLYVQLGETPVGEQFDRHSVTPQTILERARPIFEPYSLDFRICDWQSVYTVGQRVAPQFSYKDKIFLCGDAVHTHSPTMGQGMNVSMQDAYNLGWKLCSVIDGTAKSDILSTYNDERRTIALELIELDKRMTDFYSNGPSEHSQEYSAFREKFSRFLSGVSVTYSPNILTTGIPPQQNGVSKKQVSNGERKCQSLVESVDGLANHVQVGQRIPSVKVVCQAEANAVQLHDLLPSNGKWRILVFAGAIASPSRMDVVQQLGDALENLHGIHSTIDVLLIHSGSKNDFSVLDLHKVYHPWDDRLGWDYWKVFSDDDGTAYAEYGIDKQEGCAMMLRPDQHVSYIGPLPDNDAISRFFDRVLKRETFI